MSNYCIIRLFVLYLNLITVFSSFHGDLKKNHNLKNKYYDDRRTVLTAIRRNILYNSLLNVPDHTCEGNGAVLDFIASTLFNTNPETSEDIGVKYILYSRKIRTPTVISMSENYTREILPSDFDAKKQTVFIIHGWQSSGNARWVIDMTDAFLEWGDLNVFVVDWEKGSSSWNYLRAVNNVKKVGEGTNKFIKWLMDSAGLQPKTLHLIGHSLGSHICPYASKGIKGIKRITGLDPAPICVGTPELSAKLSKSDADFVDVIHTNAGDLQDVHFGIPEPMGHADFYPNGGSYQPGCESGTNKLVSQAVCSHERAYTYFTETIRHPDCLFLAHPCIPDENEKLDQCRSRESPESPGSILSPKPCALMGLPVNITARGTYYVEIKEKAPWCRFVDELKV